MPAHFEFVNGGEVVGLIPTRYPDTDLTAGDRLALSLRTDWRETAPGVFVGLGQHLLVTDSEEVGLMDVRSVVLDAA
jgi:type VI secretion system protein ImpE